MRERNVPAQSADNVDVCRFVGADKRSKPKEWGRLSAAVQVHRTASHERSPPPRLRSEVQPPLDRALDRGGRLAGAAASSYPIFRARSSANMGYDFFSAGIWTRSSATSAGEGEGVSGAVSGERGDPVSFCASPYVTPGWREARRHFAAAPSYSIVQRGVMSFVGPPRLHGYRGVFAAEGMKR